MVLKKKIKGCLSQNKNIIFIKNEEKKIRLSCLKKMKKKICILFVSDKYRKQGSERLLIEESIKYLETTRPLITFTKDKLSMFEKIIIKYNWKLKEIVNGIYNDGIRKFYFNGQLTKQNYREKLIDTLIKIKDKAKNEFQDSDKLK